MNSDAIAKLVTESAERFGDHNPQQFQQLCLRLRKAEPGEVLRGLLAVFAQGKPPPKGSAAQELAGRLLVEVAPRATLELKPVLRQVLPQYELSVEQLPLYLAILCGQDAVVQALSELSHEPHPKAIHRALETMMFWLRNQPPPGVPNAAPGDQLDLAHK